MVEFRLNKDIISPSNHLGDHTLLFAGGKKTGKTSLAIQFEDSYVLEFEPGNASHLECAHKDITNWKEATQALTFLGKNPNFCKTLVLDEIGALHWYCELYARAQLNKPEIKKSDYDVWGVVKRLFTSYIQALEALPMGKIYTCHQDIRTIETRGGAKLSFLQEALTDGCKKVMDIYTKMNAFIMLNKKGERELIIQGDDYIKAGNGFHTHFLDEKGNQFKKIPLGKDPKTAFKMLNLAWNNQLTVNENGQIVMRQVKPRKPQVANLSDFDLD